MKNTIPSQFQKSFVRVLKDKAKIMDYDEFNHYFVKHIILPYSKDDSKDIRKDICVALGNCKDDISIIFKRLKEI